MRAPNEEEAVPAIIALAVYPTVPEALPRLFEALDGPGRPLGIIGCEPCEGGIAIEWDEELTPASLVIGLIDVELRRFASGRTARLLSPLSQATIARIAAAGLLAPEIGTDRILEALIEGVGRRV